MSIDVTILTLRPGTQPRAVAALEAALAAGPGKLLAVWASDIGALNQVMILRDFGSLEEATKARATQSLSANPFGIGEFVASFSSDTFVPFPFVPALKTGELGPVFEVRTYQTRPDGLAGTMEAWQRQLDGRMKLSPVLTAMYAVSGGAPRFMHVWPYKSLDERRRIRSEAVEAGIWPPKGGADRLLTMRSDIYLPAPYSPIR